MIVKLIKQHRMMLTAGVIMGAIMLVPLIMNIVMGGRPWVFVAFAGLGVLFSIVMTPLMNNRYTPAIAKHNPLMMVLSAFISVMLLLLTIDGFVGWTGWSLKIGLPIVLVATVVLAILACLYSYTKTFRRKVSTEKLP